jgi:diadenosine tetraphosphatase ApaH/serine/threonine PP2A family protein phosphatase
MIARHDTHTEKADIWSRLAEPLPNGVVYWRQDGKVIARDGKYFARFVAYIEANTARERLDAVVPGEWDLTLELLPPIPGLDDGGDGAACSFKARLQILGVIREDVGTGRDYKAAATDAFKRAAVRFGIAHELYAYEQNWVQVDGDGRNAKPLEDPGVVYARRFGPANGAALPDDRPVSPNGSAGHEEETGSAPARARAGVAKRVRPSAAATATEAPEPVAEATVAEPVSTPSCPKCDGRMWDNRLSKRNPKAPDFKCRDRSCDGVIWPPRAGGSAGANEAGNTPAESRSGSESLAASPLGMSLDDLPF